MSMYHFWFSEQREIKDYEHYARDLEWGQVSTLSIPRFNTCILSSGGEEVEVRYNLAAENKEAYDHWNIQDLVYLGTGTFKQSRSMTHSEVVTRCKELDMIIPSVLWERK